MLFRLNRFRQDGITKEIRKEIKRRFEESVGSFDAVIFADFSYGVFDVDDVNSLVSLARKQGAFVAADSQTSSQIGNLSRFKGSNLICPTEREARMEVRGQDGLIVLSQKLLEQVEADYIFLKLGADGLLINGEELRTDHIPALNDNPVDVSGAGDSLLAAATLSFASGANPYVSALLGNMSAALQISRLGNTPITGSTLKEIVGQLN
jgi:bifunctional ADP-heptose synthase (sugar kinase/adenylyltransferase)